MKVKMPRRIGMRRQKNGKKVYFIRSIKTGKDLTKIPFHRRRQIV